jgi:glycosyltransferase involved in cell wall biosynthesis
MIKLAIVSPCYNEESVLKSSAQKLMEVYNSLILKKKISIDSFILFVNDGSIDRTWEYIKLMHEANPHIKGLCLSHNVGHQNAIMAGMMTARNLSDAIITIDADLQDDLNAIEKMIDANAEGYDVVYGVKVSRKADPILKRISAVSFYKLQQKMGVDCVYNHADFRFMSKSALNLLSQYKEKNLYLRGLIPLIGLPSTTVEDRISERMAGSSKYTFNKMIGLALDGITSFSVKPIFIIMHLGFFFLLISLLIGIDIIYSLVTGNYVKGWASLMVSIWFTGGVVLVALGTIGLYIGKIYKETKCRPLYNIKDFLND